MRTSHRRVIEGGSHSTEKARLELATLINTDALYVGSVGIQLHVYDYGKNISNKIAPTQDTDVVMRQYAVESLSGKIHAPIEYHALIHSSRTEYDYTGRKDTVIEEPFGLLRLAGSHPSVRTLFANLDIFTEKTGIGPIPITAEVLSSYDHVTVEGIGVNIARPFFTIASQTNPFAVTDKRLNRLFFLLIQTYSLEGKAAYQAQLNRAIEYLGYGNAIALAKLEENPALQNRKEITQYERKVRSVGHRIGTNLKNKFYNVSQSMHVSEQDSVEAREIAAAAFANYSSPTHSAASARALSQALRT